MPQVDAAPPHQMTSAQKAALLDAALRSRDAGAYFRAAISTFRVLGRHHDGEATIWMSHLHATREIEALLMLRAKWRGDRRIRSA